MKHVKVTELRQKLPEYMAKVRRGERFRVTSRGRVIAEIATAVRRGRLALGVSGDQWLGDLHQLPELHFEPVSAGIAQLAGSFDEAAPGDPADRIIAATAIALESRLVTADQRLRRTPRLQAVW